HVNDPPILLRGMPIQTVHPSWQLTVTNSDDLRCLRRVWADHRGAQALGAHLADDGRGSSRRCAEIDGDLIALPIRRVEPVEASNGSVYDFSVETDENFIAGMGGL